jgi:hypothetical protein
MSNNKKKGKCAYGSYRKMLDEKVKNNDDVYGMDDDADNEEGATKQLQKVSKRTAH